ncbi:MAG: gliding motility-associated C-terminal domain-containing protein [Bacteroidetes bacterium]|nr:gliding motility-associated C-terminal domain-containing protein [Bacteroidota bacterium]
MPIHLRLYFSFILAFAWTCSPAQFSTIFLENFENCNSGNVPPAPTTNNCGWTWVGTTPGSPWRVTGNSCTIAGAYSLAVGSDAIDCQYNYTFGGAGQNRRTYKSVPGGSAGYQLLEVTFTWRSGGEAGIDYGQAVYSVDGVSWNILPGSYQGSPGIQTTAPLTLPSTTWNVPQIFIGFEWYNNANAIGVFPGFTIDDINIRAEQIIPNDPPSPVAGASTCDSMVISWGGTPPSPSNVVWYWQGTSCGTSTSLGSASTYTAYSSGTYYIHAYNTVSGAWSANCASVAVTVDSPSPTANAGPSGSECDLDYNLNAVPSVGTGNWQQLFGPGFSTFSSPLSPTATVTVNDYGNYIFEWSEQNGSCIESDTLIVTFYQQPSANAGYGGEQCGLNFIFNAVPSAGTGTWSQVAGPGTSAFTNPNSPNTDVTVSTFGAYDFSWTETNGACSSSDVITVNFYDQPVSDGGTGGNECDFDFTFSAVPSLGNGFWTQIFGPGISAFSPGPNDPAATVTVTLYGTYVYRWGETNGTCSDYEDITVNFFAPPIADAGVNDTLCGLTYQLNGVPSIGLGIWSQVSGTGTSTFTNPNNPLTEVTVTLTGSYTFEWLVNNNGCTASDQVIIIFSDPPLANAGTNGNECNLDHVMSAVPSTGTGTWSLSFGPGTNIFFSPGANDPAAIVSVDVYGTYIFTWTEDNGLCAASDNVSVNFFMQPTADAGQDDTACALSFTLTAFPTIGIGQWSMASGPGTSSFTNPNSFTTDVTVSVYGTYDFQWKETNVTCSDSNVVTILFQDAPTPYAGADANVCALTNILAAVASTGTGQWSQNFGAGIATFTTPSIPSSVVDVNQYGTYVFRWTETNNGCVAYDEVTVNFYEQPVSDAGIFANICGNSTTLYATPSAGSGTWTQYTGPGATTFGGNIAPVTTAIATVFGNYIYQWTEINGVCSDSDTVTVVFWRQPKADAGIVGKSCGLSFTLDANPSVGTGTWGVMPGSGTATFSNVNDSAATTTVSNTGDYIFVWEEVNGPCTSSDNTYVSFYPMPVASAGKDTTISLGDVATLHGTGGYFGYFFFWSPDSTLTDPNLRNPDADPRATQTYKMLVTTLDGCRDSDEVVITVVSDYQLRVMDVITPNADGYNDKWFIDNIEFYPSCDVLVFNRYGNIVYQKNGYLNDWAGEFNGKPLPHGTYYYVIKCTGNDKTWKGNITIVK